MFVLFGSKTSKKIVLNGLRTKRYCPKCRCNREFQECRWSKNATLYLVPLFELEKGESALTCTVCDTSFLLEPDLSNSDHFYEEFYKDNIGIKRPSILSNPDQTENTKKRIIHCKHCKKRIRVPDAVNPIIVTCPHCKNKFNFGEKTYSELEEILEIDSKIDVILMNDREKKIRLLEHEKKKFPLYSELEIFKSVLQSLHNDNR